MLKTRQILIPAGKLADVYGSRAALSRTHPNFYLSFKIKVLRSKVFFAYITVLRYVRSFLPQNQRYAMLRSQLRDALKKAVLAKDAVSVTTVRLILAALKERDIAARGEGNTDGIPDEEILTLLQAMVKQRRESIEMYTKGNRPELAAQEASEIGVIERFLPKQMSDEEIEAAVKAAVTDLGATCLKDMGRTMAALREQYASCMDFGKAGGVAKKLLG
tara:strand:- start:363497 stop:364150 length:654 start_codon:yes stop_codon:yes gene_type:complete